MGGYEHNDTIATHIWESLVDKETETVTAEIQGNDGKIPPLHQDCLTHAE
jgi:hypothetical protein